MNMFVDISKQITKYMSDDIVATALIRFMAYQLAQAISSDKPITNNKQFGILGEDLQNPNIITKLREQSIILPDDIDVKNIKFIIVNCEKDEFYLEIYFYSQ